MLADIFIFLKKIDITILAKILNIVAKFRKDSIFKVDIFAKLSLKYWQNFRSRNTTS